MDASASVPEISFFASHPLERAVKAAGAIVGLNRDPNRLDLVFVLGETVNRRVLPRVWRAFAEHADGRRVLRDEPAIDSRHVDFDGLAKLPDGTLGREYVRFLRDNGITPDVFKAPEGIDPRAAFLAQRLRQTHDLWHVVTGYKTDVRGEVLLQAFTWAQLGIPSSGMIALFGGARGLLRAGAPFAREWRRAIAHGKRAAMLAPFYWEEHWGDSVESLRARLDCPSVATLN